MADSLERLQQHLGGRYRIEREIGRGGMATVWLAEDLKHHRPVAIKVLNPDLSAAVSGERFLQEIQVTAGLQHPHVLPLFDSGDADGMLFYVMPFVAGESLRHRLDRDGRLPLDQALAIAGDVAAALTVAHARGIVHRDIKPENILIEDGEGLVADFGIALALAGSADARLTSAGLSIGTPAYMSPEQVAGDSTIDGRSDTYALACVLFEMLTGQPPFTGASPQAIIGRALGTTAPTARSLVPNLPAEVDVAIARALAKDPADRFATPRDFIDAATPAVRAPHRRLWLAGAAVALLATAAAFAVPLWRARQTAAARAMLTTIAALAREGRYAAAYQQAIVVERRIPTDTTLQRLMGEVSDAITVTSVPAGAQVYLQRAPDADGAPEDSVELGTTPITDHRVARGDYRIVIRHPDYATAERMISSALGRAEQRLDEGRVVSIATTLVRGDSVPDGMIAVPGGRYTLVGPDLPVDLADDLEPFLIDQHEVSNGDYSEFIAQGGYGNLSWWRRADADGIARSQFTDRTGLQAPREWVSQEGPAGRGRHPVTGISWYEADAYCTAQGKRLPTLFEWEKVARDGVTSLTGVIMPWGYTSAVVADNPRANFSSASTVPVDAMPFGMSPYGAHAMAGNVKEWLANPVDNGFAVAGGSWQDPAYLFSEVGSVKATDASGTIGVRCARNRGIGSAATLVARRLQLHAPPPVYHPVDASTYRSLLTFYRYDRRPANPRTEVVETTAGWTRERVWIDGVAGDSVLIHLFLPVLAAPPFQTLLYIPSSAAFFFAPVWQSAAADLGPHIKAGRAVAAVVLKGMVERPVAGGLDIPPSESVRFRDLMVLHATEMRLAIDYLETRREIDMNRLAYVGVSFGAGSRLPFAAVDNRFRSVVLIGAGIDERVQPTLPEAANYNFAPYISVPKLMLNGRLDEEHPWTTRAEPLWKLLREPKELVLIDGVGHHPPVEQRVAPINAFLDRTLGPVRPRESGVPANE